MTTPADPEAETPATASHRIAAFDGLRALCIVAVTLLHAGFGSVVTGRVGVYVFFTLSGFLITTLLLREHDSTERVRLGAFYERRARRLLPALGVFLVAFLAYGAVDDAAPFHPGADAYAAVIFYYANWKTITDGVGGMGAFGHVWSLSVEEQFYVAWPLLLLLVGRLRTGVRSVALLLICAGGVAVSIVARWWIIRGRGSLEHLLVGTDTSADHLLVGCALAIVVAGASAAQLQKLASALRYAVVLAALYFSYVLFIDRHFLFGNDPVAAWFPGMQTGIAVASAVVIGHLLLNRGSVVVRVLSRRPLARLGEISYGWYLWHVPVFAALREHLDPYNRLVALVIGCAITWAASTASFNFVEDPIRRAGRGRQRPVEVPVVARSGGPGLEADAEDDDAPDRGPAAEERGRWRLGERPAGR